METLPSSFLESQSEYVTMFLNSALGVLNPLAPLSLLFLFLCRFLPIIALSPFFGSRVLPHPVKVTFAISMFVIFLPRLIEVSMTPLEFNLYLLILAIKELFIGLCLGYIISLPFIIVQSAGIYIDHQRGGASLMVNDPTIQNQSSPLGTLFNYVLIFMFFLINGPFQFIDAIMTSYEVVPPDQFLGIAFFSPESPYREIIVSSLGKAMKIALQLASPSLLAMLMTDSFLGIANRLAPQVEITFLGMPLKSLLGLTVVCLGWQVLLNAMVKDSQGWLHVIDEVNAIFRSARTGFSGG